MTRPVLAGLVGRGAVWLKKIESGERELNSITMLVRLASALHLDDVSLLTGGASVPVTSGKLSHESVPLIRDAMHTVAFLPRPPEVPAPAALRGRVEQAWRLWHTSRFQRTEVGALLPSLIIDAHACMKANKGDAQREAQAAAGDLYRLVQRHLAHISEAELYWLALDRSRSYSEQADDAVSLALGAWTVSIGQRAAGYVEDAVRSAELGMAVIRPRLEDGSLDALAAYGQLNLQAATCEALDGRSGPADRYLEEAARAAAKLPDGYWHAQSAFAMSNVHVHSISLGTGQFKPGETLLRAETIDPMTVSSLERRSRLLMDIASAHHQRKEGAAAVHYLSQACEVTPEGVRYVPGARALAAAIEKDAKGALKASASALAQSLGVAA